MRKAGVKIENKFIRGLITENTALNFPEDACTDILNCVLDKNGRIKRRLGLDYEISGTRNSVTTDITDVYTEYVWSAVAGLGTISFLVQQIGHTLHFFDISNDTIPSSHKKAFTVSLNNYRPSGATLTCRDYPCQYATARGDLIVVSKPMNPIQITYDPVGNSISVTMITLMHRDFEGLDDSYDITYRPQVSVVSMITGTDPLKRHYYNLLNQGWYQGSSGTSGSYTGAALAQWDAARTDVPSNADVPSFYRSSATDIFDNNNVLASTQGYAPAPKGHYVLEVGNPVRTAAVAKDFYGSPSLFLVPGEYSSIAGGTGSIVTDMSGGGSAFDGITSQTAAGGAFKTSATTFYIGKNFGSSRKRIIGAIAYASSDQGFVTGADPTMTYYLCGKNSSAPTGPSDLGDEILASSTGFPDANGTVAALMSANASTEWQYVYVVVQSGGAAATMNCAEVLMYESTNNHFERPEVVASMAGRVFYGGPQIYGYSNSIYFTQVIENSNQLGQCYQKNDPTSENFSDLLPDDGGVIKILEIGTIKKLFPYQSSLIVLASNGIWVVKGGSGGFSANSYSIKKISSIGMNSPHSVVDYKGLPLWWGEDGIYTLKYDPNYDSFSVESLTTNTIKSFIDEIPRKNRKFVKGAYDIFKNVVYWLYSDDSSLTATTEYTYNCVLVLDGSTGSFFPWKFQITAAEIRGLTYISTPSFNADPIIKYSITEPITSTSDYFTYGDIHRTEYHDWGAYVASSYFSSYFVSGYALHGETQRFFQPNYIFVFMEHENNSSCLVQGLFDFANQSSTGKWSSQQEIYNSTLQNRDVKFRRLKIRGKGRALQLRFDSTEAKPFNIIGWAIKETQNNDI